MASEAERRAASGESGLRALLAEMRPQLCRFMVARGCEASEAEDLFQDLFIKVEELRAGPIGNARAYLFQMTSNLVLDHRRGRLRRQSRDDGWARNRFGHDLSGDPHPSPESAAIARDLLEKVQRKLDSMPERTAQVLRLYRVEGMAQKNIAAELGLSLSAVEKHLQRAYRALHEFREQVAAIPGDGGQGEGCHD